MPSLSENSYIKNAFNSLTYPVTYNVKLYLKKVSGIISYTLYAAPDFNTAVWMTTTPNNTLIGQRNVDNDTNWNYLSFTKTITNSTHKHLFIRAGRAGAPAGDGVATFLIKGLQIIEYKPAEAQDSDLLGAGRVKAHYEGTKISSTDINVDSPDTIDGGPVITINTVADTSPTYNPIGVTGPAVTMTQQQQTGQA